MSEKMFSVLMSIAYIFIETCGCICFLDTFLEYKRNKRYRVITMFMVMFAISYIWDEMLPVKLIMAMLAVILYSFFWYKASLGQCLFLALVDYGLLFLCDFGMTLLIGNYALWNEKPYELSFLVLVEKLIWLCIMLALRAVYHKRKNRRKFTNEIWRKFCIIPLMTVFSMMIMFWQWKQGNNANMIGVGTATILVVSNFIFILMIQDILEEHRKSKEKDARNHKIQSQLSVYRDMQELYDRQRQKMHDYKKQLKAIQTLLAGNHVDEADRLLTELNGSLAVDMSVVDTNQHTVNAVLNQEISRAKEKGIPVILKINDLQELKLKEDEIVILLANLLDNAITACENVLLAGGKPIIHLKLIYENEKLICSVKNPVVKRVEIEHNIVQAKSVTGHGLGLLNVKEVVERYDGDIILNCDEKEFSVVVML